MTTIAYRQVLERQRRYTLVRQDGNYPLNYAQIDMMVERYAAKREQSFAKAGLSTQRAFILDLGRAERRYINIFTEGDRQALQPPGAARRLARSCKSIARCSKRTRRPTKRKPFSPAVMRILNVRLWQMDTFVPSAESMVERIAFGTVEGINLRFSLGVQIPDWAMRQIVSDGGKRMGLMDFTTETRDALFRSIREGRELGENSAKVAQRIRSEVPAGRFRNAGAEYRAPADCAH